MPTVVAGTRDPLVPEVDLVAHDDYRGGRLATTHLLELGHQKIAHIIGVGEVGRLRRAGYEASTRGCRSAPRFRARGLDRGDGRRVGPGTLGVIGPPDRDPRGERPLRGRSPGRGG